MKNVIPYLIFNGNCKEAMEFYNSHLQADLNLMTYKDSQPDGKIPAGAENKIIHANMTKGNFSLFASDSPETPAKIGDNVQLFLNCESREEVDRIFKAFCSGGKELVPLAETFWGSYFGMLEDKFKIHWMVSVEIPKK